MFCSTLSQLAGALLAAGAETGVETGAAPAGAGTEPAAVVLDWEVAAAEGAGWAAFFLGAMAGDVGRSSGEGKRGS